MTDDVKYNKNCSWKMEQTLMDSEDLELASKTHKIMLKVMEAAGKSASKLRKLQPGLTAC
jgi:hypothetical protein